METLAINGTLTSDVRLVAAVLAMGIPVDEYAPTVGIEATQHSTRGVRTWNLGKVSNCGKYTLAQLQAAWNDRSFHVTHPQHPFAFVKAALWNHKVIVEALKGAKPLVQISKGDSIALIHPDCSSVTEEKILTRFNR